MIPTITTIILLILSVVFNLIFLSKKINNTKIKKELIDREYELKILKDELKIQENELKTQIKSVKSVLNNDIRKGYYENSLRWGSEVNGYENYSVDVYVIEVDRYTNGKSKIKLDYVNVGQHPNSMPIERAIEYCTKNFKELVNTNEIVWLESVDAVSKMRKKKFERIMKDGNTEC